MYDNKGFNGYVMLGAPGSDRQPAAVAVMYQVQPFPICALDMVLSHLEPTPSC